MNGSEMTRDQILKVLELKKETPSGDFVWDGVDEDDRPLTEYEMKSGAVGFVNKGGRPKSLSPKKSATLRYDQEILDFFKATGKGWQTRINDVLLEYVHSH